MAGAAPPGSLPLRPKESDATLKRWLTSPRGQTLLEFAFVAPIMIVFLFAIVDFGIALDRRVTLQHAVREGARKGAVTNNITGIIDTTVDQSQGLLDPPDVEVCYEDVDGNGNPGDPGDDVRVTAHFTYPLAIFGGFLSEFGGPVPSAIDMDPSADMRLENSVNPAPPCALIPVPTVPPP